ncbi:hypothetical protein [Mycobacterium nebraskense]|uniref:Uncharacterized protein n=1 Tax=Mycobacterium nebraskense TaxID=244292 RepID=A0A1X1ZX67_9MYCO|nr:hypothetical protein [Mycobacterium nebraskense]KKC06528.1 hypothetical protein WU83_02710 [Mycobacterium nebraskense]MBI2697306.1 hypothetical protein [Mycobacterium nebraskense]MCV7120737.1 hypothetical protein [Mycobacterium nebraskense]ORW28941.1 hypothetical protein AWC17_00875 [Mycobacterium nebraskense]
MAGSSTYDPPQQQTTPIATSAGAGSRRFLRLFRGPQYLRKFTELAGDVVEPAERERFLSTVDALADLPAGDLDALNVIVDPRALERAPVIAPGIWLAG